MFDGIFDEDWRNSREDTEEGYQSNGFVEEGKQVDDLDDIQRIEEEVDDVEEEDIRADGGNTLKESNDYDVIGVRGIEDDVFCSGTVIESLGYLSDDGTKEIYLEEVKEDGTLRYSLREFGNEVTVINEGGVEYDEADDPDAVIEAVVENDNTGEELIENEEKLRGTLTAETYQGV